MQVFAQANIVSHESGNLTQAMLYAQSAAEAFKATGGDLDETASLLDGSHEGDKLTVQYNGSWQLADREEDAVGSLILTRQEVDGLITGDIVVVREEKIVFQLQTMLLSAR